MGRRDDLHRLSDRAVTGDVAFGELGSAADEAIIAWSRDYCRGVRRKRAVDVRFDLVEWEVSTRAKRRAAAVKRPKLPDATIGEPYDWDSLDNADGRPLPCTLSLTREAVESFDRDEWESTLRHELIHVEQFQRDGTTGHGPAFRQRAEELDTEVHCPSFAEPEYILDCSSCGETVAHRYRECKLVREPERYRSDCCSAALSLAGGTEPRR